MNIISTTVVYKKLPQPIVSYSMVFKIRSKKLLRIFNEDFVFILVAKIL